MTQSPRPVLTLTTAADHPAALEAKALYDRTASLPLGEWPPLLPLELREYLDLIYAGAPEGPRTPIPLTSTVIHEPAVPWDTLTPTNNVFVAFTGGKDSVAAALHVANEGRTPVLWHVAGLNRGMGDEPRYAQRIADRMGWRLLVDRVAVRGGKTGVMELPTKNQVTALLLTARMASLRETGLASADYVSGWHASDTQDKQAFGYDYSDGVEAIAAFNRYLSARFPGLAYEQVLQDTTEAWARIAEAGLIQFIKGCVCPLRYKANLRRRNVAKFGWLLAGRCGSCVKCAWEERALQGLGVIPFDMARLAHGLPWLLRDFGPRLAADERADGSPVVDPDRVIEFLVPEAGLLAHARPSGDWPTQHAPEDEAEGTPLHIWPVSPAPVG